VVDAILAAPRIMSRAGGAGTFPETGAPSLVGAI
jgi:hypothetical protein